MSNNNGKLSFNRSALLESLWRTLRSAICASLVALITLSSSASYAQSLTSFGTNVEPTDYYNQDGMFVDLFLHATAFWQNNGTTFTTGPDGMITSGTATTLIETGGYPSGTYQFYGEGAFKIGFRGAAYDTWPNNGTIPGSQQTVNNVTTALVSVTVPDPAVPTDASYTHQAEMLIDVTATDPNNPPKNFHLIEPGYPIQTIQHSAINFSKHYLRSHVCALWITCVLISPTMDHQLRLTGRVAQMMASSVVTPQEIRMKKWLS